MLLWLLLGTVSVGLVLFLAVCAGVTPRSYERMVSHISRRARDPFGRRKLPKWAFDLVTDDLLLGPLPTSEASLQELVDCGVKAVVSVNESWELHLSSSSYKKHNITHLHLATPDYFSPSSEDIDVGVKFIIDQVSLGHKVYCHCKSGVGRSAVITVAYLVASRNWTLEQSYAYLKQRRSRVKIPNWFGLRPHWRRLAVWYEQFARLRDYEDELRGTEPKGKQL
eukprot:TRINITY_DN2523_c0_g1_i1.p1 TRINITY_DN2523_c0_g1~~TRINITY_DN2523_c0_g1_i1.p1  ORF type:complete len:247 (+),score=26.24 TRINITY_DN2523_c0_g1_i1:71-742(+)